jgi:acylphosphatase
MSVKAGQTAIRVRARVTGRVQGVSYRASARAVAGGLGLVGWVRNTRDGSVELEAEGPREQVGELLRWCDRGPTAARVAAVEVTEIEPTGNDASFRVTY